MTVVEQDTEAQGTNQLASWSARAGALVVDLLPGLLALASAVLVAWSTKQLSWLWWVSIVAAGVVLFAMALNRLLVPSITGWTVGRALFGIEVVRADAEAPGPWQLLAREAAHVVDTLPLLGGWLWPLWDNRSRTFADIVARTEVHRLADKPAQAKTNAIKWLTAAAVVAAAIAALGYFTVYRSDLRLAQAREELAVQGPKLVTGMLTYHKDSLQADFDRANASVTDGYRPQLVQQQEAVKKAGASGAIDNEYWSPDSAVLTATADRGTMLIVMQGQRGVPPKFQTLSATVKAEFERGTDGQWKVANLTPVISAPRQLSAPANPGAAQPNPTSTQQAPQPAPTSQPPKGNR